MRAKGYIPDPEGHQVTGFHVLAAARATTTPATADLTPLAPPVMDQGQCGSCTGHGTAVAIAIACPSLGFVPSPRGEYDVARCIDRVDPSVPLGDDGAMPNSVMRGIQEWGVRPIQGMPTDCTPANVNTEPTLAELTEDSLECFVGAYRIASTGAARTLALRQAIAAGHPVGVGTFVASSFESWQAGDPPCGAQDQNDPQGGGHWTCLIAYRTAPDGSTEFKIRNSWGESWGEDGNIWVTEAFMNQATDLYVFAIKVAP